MHKVTFAKSKVGDTENSMHRTVKHESNARDQIQVRYQSRAS